MSLPHRAPESPNRLTPFRFVVAFGVVSMLADFVYEGARSIVGPYLATFGASAAAVGAVTGAGEAVALVFRLFTGPLSDRTRRYWPITVSGYAITVVAVPLLAVTQAFAPAAAAALAERFGKAVRTPARDTMLAAASTTLGTGRTFALHEALDQSGALFGPLLVAAMVAVSGYRLGFAVLALPGIGALGVLWWLRRAVPVPAAYATAADATAAPGAAAGPHPAGDPGQVEPEEPRPGRQHFSRRFWVYSAFGGLTMVGYGTFGVLAYHLEVRHVVPTWEIPVIYAAAMGVDALGALASGWVYDRVGLRGLVVLPLLAAAIPFLSFSNRPALVWAGALLWGLALGIHESTLRAAVTDLVPAERRGTGYGTFTAVYGLGWLVGGTVIGALYDSSLPALQDFVLASQAAALLAFIPLARSRKPPAPAVP